MQVVYVGVSSVSQHTISFLACMQIGQVPYAAVLAGTAPTLFTSLYFHRKRR